MKKIMNGLLIISVLLLLSACNKTVNPVKLSETENWITVNDSAEKEELSDKFKKAVEGILDVNYKAEKYLETKSVSGTDYRFLASGISDTDSKVEGMYIIIFNEDSKGNIKLDSIQILEEKTLNK